jgi:hypothetical protein
MATTIAGFFFELFPLQFLHQLSFSIACNRFSNSICVGRKIRWTIAKPLSIEKLAGLLSALVSRTIEWLCGQILEHCNLCNTIRSMSLAQAIPRPRPHIAADWNTARCVDACNYANRQQDNGLDPAREP